jgi:transcriptional regulator with XRE-family HTH domain
MTQGKIVDYCKEKGISITKMAELCGISFIVLYRINKDPMFNLTIDTIQKIYLGTKEAYGRGLRAEDYLDWPCLHLKN